MCYWSQWWWSLIFQRRKHSFLSFIFLFLFTFRNSYQLSWLTFLFLFCFFMLRNQLLSNWFFLLFQTVFLWILADYFLSLLLTMIILQTLSQKSLFFLAFLECYFLFKFLNSFLNKKLSIRLNLCSDVYIILFHKLIQVLIDVSIELRLMKLKPWAILIMGLDSFLFGWFFDFDFASLIKNLGLIVKFIINDSDIATTFYLIALFFWFWLFRHLITLVCFQQRRSC
jgi:hypothetical protein